MGGRKRAMFLRSVVFLAICFCTGLLAPTFASATSRNLETSIPTGAGPSALAVDDSNGDIYVAEFVGESFNVSRFDSTGESWSQKTGAKTNGQENNRPQEHR